MLKKYTKQKKLYLFILFFEIIIAFCLGLCGCPSTYQHLTTEYWILVPAKYTVLTYIPKTTSEFTVFTVDNEKITPLLENEKQKVFTDTIPSSTQIYKKYKQSKDNWNVFYFKESNSVGSVSTDKKCSQIIYFKLYSETENPIYFSLTITNSLEDSQVEYALPSTCIQGIGQNKKEVEKLDIAEGFIFCKTAYSMEEIPFG